MIKDFEERHDRAGGMLEVNEIYLIVLHPPVPKK
jgi:hypothetical protein